MTTQIPFSNELGHLFLHLFPLQLFLQQNLKSCDVAVALGILLIGLRDKHSKHTRNPLNQQTLSGKHVNITPRQSGSVKQAGMAAFSLTSEQ